MLKILFLIAFVAVAIGCHSPQKSHSNKIANPPPALQLRDRYRISKVDSIQNVYIIYAMNQSGQYKIVSLLDSSANCKRVRVNDEVAFRLVSIVQTETRNASHVSAITFHGVMIPLESASQRNIHVANNLTGLCIK